MKIDSTRWLNKANIVTPVFRKANVDQQVYRSKALSTISNSSPMVTAYSTSLGASENSIEQIQCDAEEDKNVALDDCESCSSEEAMDDMAFIRRHYFYE